jgi:hypothetical protein
MDPYNLKYQEKVPPTIFDTDLKWSVVQSNLSAPGDYKCLPEWTKAYCNLDLQMLKRD